MSKLDTSRSFAFLSFCFDHSTNRSYSHLDQTARAQMAPVFPVDRQRRRYLEFMVDAFDRSRALVRAWLELPEHKASGGRFTPQIECGGCVVGLYTVVNRLGPKLRRVAFVTHSLEPHNAIRLFTASGDLIDEVKGLCELGDLHDTLLLCEGRLDTD
jgi:hypothetical protein